MNFNLSITPEEYLKRYENGQSDMSVASDLGITRYHISKLRKSLGLPTLSRKKINKISDTEAICSRCSCVLPLTEFQWGRKNLPDAYQFSFCNECRQISYYARMRSDRTSYLKERVKIIGRRAVKAGIPFDLTLDFIEELWQNQDGKCFYSDIPMTWGSGEGLKHDRISVDKVVVPVGYVQGNVVLCIRRTNFIKHNMTLEEMSKWTPDWYQRLKNSSSVTTVF